jgi:hypothetical protein
MEPVDLSVKASEPKASPVMLVSSKIKRFPASLTQRWNKLERFSLEKLPSLGLMAYLILLL